MPSDQDLHTLAGQLRAMLDLCVAIIVTHPRPQEVLPIFDKLAGAAQKKANEDGMSSYYIHGLENFSIQLKATLQTTGQIDALQTLPPQGGHKGFRHGISSHRTCRHGGPMASRATYSPQASVVLFGQGERRSFRSRATGNEVRVRTKPDVPQRLPRLLRSQR